MNVLLASLLLSPLLSLLPAQAWAASFDCRHTNSNIEKLVCADKSVSTLDEAMAAAYRRALGSVNPDARKKLVLEQKTWLKESRSLCDDAACLKRAYEGRLALLRECNTLCSTIAEAYERNGAEYNLVISRNANERNASFTEDLRERGFGGIAGCESLVQIRVGTASGNNSFGGLCKIGHRKSDQFFMVCDDNMLGHFKLIAAAPAASQKQLINFTIDNCFGG